MAIQSSKTIKSIEVLNSGDKDIACQVQVEFTSYDDSDQDGTTITCIESFNLNTDDRTSSSDGWVAYASLDAATVEGWLGSELTDRIASVQANHNGWINSVLTPPAPPTVDKALPW
jgi:hypothetical protein